MWPMSLLLLNLLVTAEKIYVTTRFKIGKLHHLLIALRLLFLPNIKNSLDSRQDYFDDKTRQVPWDVRIIS